jgi:hypothetical protein
LLTLLFCYFEHIISRNSVNSEFVILNSSVQFGPIDGILDYMQPPTESTVSALDRLLEPLSRSLGFEAAQQILALRVDPVVQARIDDLADRCNEGALTAPERTEYEGYVEGISLINILKVKARRVLSAQRSNA